MKPLAVFSSLAVLCAGGLLALSYQGWQDDPSVVTAMTQADQKVSIDGREAVSTPPAATAPASQQPAASQTAAVQPGTSQGSAATDQQPTPEGAAKSDSAQQPAATEPAGNEAEPSFDIVRLEEDGSAVLAGRAAPGTTVTALLNGEAMGEAVANDRGEWVILPSRPLPPGAHEVTLSQAGADGAVVQSGQSVALTVPDTPGTQPLIVLSETSKPSRVLQKPAAEAAAAAEPATTEPVEEKVAAAEPAQSAEPAQQPAAESAATSSTTAQPAQESAAATAPAASQAQDRSLTVDVVDYDAQGRTTFSGKAAAGSRVRVYVSDRFTGEAEADATGAWTITPSRDIEAGTHSLRADLIGPDGNVGERIELPFLRESPERIAGLQAGRSGEAGTSEQAAEKQPETQQQASTEPQQNQQQAAAEQPKPEPSVAEPAATEQAATEPAQQTAAAPAAAQQPQGPGRVVIQPGNNLWQISRVIYGKGVQFTVIYEANKDQIRNPNLIYPGQILDTPGSNAPESIDPDCRKPLAECKEEAKGAAQ